MNAPEQARVWLYDDSVEFEHDSQTMRGYVRFEEKPGIFEVLVVDPEDYDEVLVAAEKLRPGPVTLVQHLTECYADPPHSKVWIEIEEHRGYYLPLPCPLCQLDSACERHDGCEHARHYRWQSWKITGRVFRWTHSMGITTGGGYRFGGGCPGCEDIPKLRGKRNYILGVSRESWRCLIRYRHRRLDLGGGLCGKCCPCAGCKSVTWAHEPGCPEDPDNWVPDPLISPFARRAGAR